MDEAHVVFYHLKGIFECRVFLSTLRGVQLLKMPSLNVKRLHVLHQYKVWFGATVFRHIRQRVIISKLITVAIQLCKPNQLSKQ